jgi:antitoxin component of MazEF toxin-antitoxin module
MRFRTTIVQSGTNTTGIEVPEDVVAALGLARRLPVRITVGDHSYRSTVAPLRGHFMVSLSAENRASAGVAGGDEVDVDIELDTEPRAVTVPPDLAAALDAEPGARRFFDGLSNSHQQRHVLAIDGAKTDETRQRRIAKAVDVLREGRR